MYEYGVTIKNNRLKRTNQISEKDQFTFKPVIDKLLGLGNIQSTGWELGKQGRCHVHYRIISSIDNWYDVYTRLLTKGFNVNVKAITYDAGGASGWDRYTAKESGKPNVKKTCMINVRLV